MMNACRILPEAGAAGKSACSLRTTAHAAPRDESATCPAAAVLAGLSWNG
jgi:hypothetical protein